MRTPGGEEVLLLLGGNTGDVRTTLAAAEERLGEHAGRLVARSRDHWTEPVGLDGGGLFLNRAVLLATALPPDELMRTLLAIERELGRMRAAGPPQPRPIDIDVLLWGGRIIATSALTVPHPRMHLRGFALAPAADIAPGMVHPVLHRSVLELLGDLRRHA